LVACQAAKANFFVLEFRRVEKWECLDSDTSEVLAEAVRKHHLPDFSNWQPPPAALARAFARLEKDLRLSIGKSLSRQGQPEISLLLK